MKAGTRVLLSMILMALATAAQAQVREPAWAPRSPVLVPASDGNGTYALRMRVLYLETMTGNLELRRHQYFLDDNLKTQWPRTSVAWHFRWYF